MVSEHALFLCFIHLPFLHPRMLPKAKQSDPTTNFSRLASTLFAYYITCPTYNKIMFWFEQTITFSPVYLFYIFEFEHAWICFIPIFHSFSIFPSQCAPMGSVEWPLIATENGQLCYLDVQKQSNVPICLETHNVCSTLPPKNPHYSVQAPPTSCLN